MISMKLSNVQPPRFLPDFTNRLICKAPDQFAQFLPQKPIGNKMAMSHSKGQSTCRLHSFLIPGMLYRLGQFARSEALMLAWRIGLPLLASLAPHRAKSLNPTN